MILEHSGATQDRARLRESVIAMVRKVNPPRSYWSGPRGQRREDSIRNYGRA
ncbi:hypothetical protein BDB13_6395 [Rhodococcus sp. OK302]|nr:hypothetical protein BDB13_6395 [Rhodococcus sp. OK302]